MSAYCAATAGGQPSAGVQSASGCGEVVREILARMPNPGLVIDSRWVTMQPMWYRILKVVLLGAVLAAAMQVIRLRLIEPDTVAQACTLNGLPLHCKLRTMVVNGFAHHLYGPISLIAAILAWVGGLGVFAVLAMLSGMAGMVLWNFELSALGFLLGALLLARGRSEAPVVEQQTQSQ